MTEFFLLVKISKLKMKFLFFSLAIVFFFFSPQTDLLSQVSLIFWCLKFCKYFWGFYPHFVPQFRYNFFRRDHQIWVWCNLQMFHTSFIFPKALSYTIYLVVHLSLFFIKMSMRTRTTSTNTISDTKYDGNK